MALLRLDVEFLLRQLFANCSPQPTLDLCRASCELRHGTWYVLLHLEGPDLPRGDAEVTAIIHTAAERVEFKPR